MLYIVLVLVLAALGLLVTALITASSLWAWVSIGLSVLAGLILVADWLRRRRRAAAPAPEPAAAEPPADDSAPAEPAPAEEAPAEPAPAEPEEEQTTLIPAAGDLGDPADTPEPDVAEEEPPAAAPLPESDPGEEETPVDDIAVLADLDDEVVVVDEHPRYHLTTCVWLGSRERIPIGVGEARQLGFTPCGRCRPDATLVAAHR